jgi:DNA-binding response OmpR family regulator
MAETILIVENNPETIELLRRIMERDGYKTILANDGEKGLNYAGRYMPDLIILDRLIPKLNGLQLCRKLKEQENTRHIPVVFLTMLDGEQDIIDGLKAGADDYISKPFSPDELSVRVERVLFRSVRSVIEDLLSDTAAPSSQADCLEPLIKKLLSTEKKLRRNLRQKLDTLIELCHHWNSLFHGPKEETHALLGEQSRAVEQQSVQFTRIEHQYNLVRWLVSLLYRLLHGMEARSESTSSSSLKRMYAESTIVMQKIEAARHILEKTNRFIRQFQ